MNIRTVKTDNGQVSCETPEGTVVHIHITQRSALDSLQDFFGNEKKSGEKTNPSPVSGTAADLGFGAAYITLGLVSVTLAIILNLSELSLKISYSGLHFWVGFPFLVFGILNLVAYKSPNQCWTVLAFVCRLVNFVVSIAGIFVTIDDIRFRFMDYQQVCDDLRYGRGYYGRATMPPRYNYERDYELQNCKYNMYAYKVLVKGVIMMTLLMMIWGVILSLFAIGPRLKSFCSSCKIEKPKLQGEHLIKPKPSADPMTV